MAEEHGLELVAALYSQALDLTADLTRHWGSSRQPHLAAAVPALLPALSFTPGLLPTCWRWLATHLGLPLEAPLEATRGLDVAALHSGYKGLAPAHALVLGLFCRLYAHLLTVVDDSEFYASAPRLLHPPPPSPPGAAAAAASGPGGVRAGGELSLGQARAVVACLNSLVFHTYLPAPPRPPKPEGGQGSLLASRAAPPRPLLPPRCPWGGW
ncbi:hypothetical protein V8C86DRAFT_1520911 [Haematococcus lacustris]